MQYLIGFVIALFIALTGVGAGTVTVPVLILFLDVPAAIAVSIGLTFCGGCQTDSGAGANRPRATWPGGLSGSCFSAERRASSSVRCS